MIPIVSQGKYLSLLEIREMQLQVTLADLHERGVVHADLKPENILLSMSDLSTGESLLMLVTPHACIISTKLYVSILSEAVC